MSKVVVITRTKDRPFFLKRCLNSVGGQAFKDYIHVIVNDGGDKDKVDTCVASLSVAQQEKTKVFHRDESSGAPDTIFNESINRIDSEYFAIHDDDDSWHPNFLTKTVEYLDTHSELGAVVVKTDKVVEEFRGEKIIEKKRSQWMPDVKVVNLYRQCIDNQMTPISTLYRRTAYEAVGKFDDTLPVVGDWEFGVRLLKRYEVDYIDPGYALAGYHHRLSGDNSFATHNHRYYSNLVMNRYLREELAAGTLGVGYIMSCLKYDQDKLHNSIKNFLPSFVVRQLKKRRQ